MRRASGSVSRTTTLHFFLACLVPWLTFSIFFPTTFCLLPTYPPQGLVTLTPFHSDRLLLSPVSLAGLLPALLLMLDPAAGMHGKHHWMLYSLAAAMNPRFMTTVDEVRGGWRLSLWGY